MTIGEKIRKARENRNLSREYLAKVLDLDVRTVGKIENDERDLGFREACLVAKALGITPQDLLFGEPRLVFDDSPSQGRNQGMLDSTESLHRSAAEQIVNAQEQLIASLREENHSKGKIIDLLEGRIREMGVGGTRNG